MVAAHRFGSSERFEGSLTAAQNALDLGVPILEFDLAMTKDNVPVISHDTFLRRLCGVEGNLRDFNYAELPPFVDKIDISFSPYDSYTRKPSDSSTFLKFEDLLILINSKDTSKNVWMNIELKEDDEPEVVKIISDLLVRYGNCIFNSYR